MATGKLALLSVVVAALLASPAHAASGKRHIPNSVKYSDRSIANATATSGSTTVEAAAFIGSGGLTTLDVTASGAIEKVHVELPSGDALNYNDLPGLGTFAAAIPGLVPHATLVLQVHVRAADSPRVEVLRLSEVVKLRPDLRVQAIDAPEQAPTRVPVSVRAIVREANGDVGARADCRLLVDGAEADRAEDIWVDAGGSVQCAFMVELESGEKNVSVVVDGVEPADWDTADNTASMLITVRPPDEASYDQWTARVSESEFDDYDYRKYTWGEFTRHNKGVEQLFGFQATVRGRAELRALKVKASATTDGALPLVAVETGTFEPFFFGPRDQEGAMHLHQPEVTIYYDDEWDATFVDVSYAASDVVYRSWGWATRDSPWEPDGPRYTWDDTYENHTLQNRFGTTVQMNVDFTAGMKIYRAAPSIVLDAPRESRRDVNYVCYRDEFLEQDICRESHFYSKTRRGSASMRF
jgi:hypothetical protein